MSMQTVTDYSNSSILIVDDDPNNLRTVFDLIGIGFPGSKVMSAPNGKIALQIAQKKLPDLIITDWEMPVMDGLELTRQLKKHPSTQDIPIIMATGVMISTENLEIAMEAGALEFLRKPIDWSELKPRVGSMLTLSHSLQRLKTLNATKDRLFSIIAHDLRSPLNALSNMITAFNMDLFNNKAELDNTMNKLGKNTQNVIGLLDNLLHWAHSQLTEESDKLEPQPISVLEIANETKELLSATAEQKKISLSVSIPANLPQAFIDKNAIRLILRNLLSNAIKFTDKGGNVILSATSEADTLKVSVTDTGVGISPERLPTIFQEDLDSTFGTSNEKGVGLGLLLCQNFVQRSGGQIGVESQLKEGTTFWFTLPSA